MWTCHFEPPEHLPRTSARAQSCVRGPGGPPAYDGAESTRKAQGPEEKQIMKGQRNTLFIYILSNIYIQGSLSGFLLREIPGVTPVEKGHAGNTAAVATANFMLDETRSKNQQDRSSC